MVINTTYLEKPRQINTRLSSPRQKDYSRQKQSNYNIHKNITPPLHSIGSNRVQPAFGGGGLFKRVFDSLKNIPAGFNAEFIENTATKTMSKAEAFKKVRKTIPKGQNEALDHLEKIVPDDGDIIIQHSGRDALIEGLLGPVKGIVKFVKKTILKDKKLLEQIEHDKKRNQVVGYLSFTDNHNKYFDEVFKGKNIDAIKKHVDYDLFFEGITPDGTSAKGNLKQYQKQLDKYALKDALEDEKIQKTGDFDELRKIYVNKALENSENKKVGSFLAPFGVEKGQLAARFVSGVIPAYFTANDFYNLKMTTSNDKNEAKKERKERFKQYGSRIAFYMYLGYVLNTIFARVTNHSLKAAFGVAVGVSVGADIISRVAKGVPLHPIKPKDTDNKPFTIHSKALDKNNNDDKKDAVYASPLEAYNASFKKNNGNNKKNVAFTGNMKILDRFHNWLGKFKLMSATMDIKDFEKTYNNLNGRTSKSSKDTAERMIQVARVNTYDGIITDKDHLKQVQYKDTHVDIEEIKRRAAKNGNKVVIGRTGVHRIIHAIGNAIMWPVKLVRGGIKGGIKKYRQFANDHLGGTYKIKKKEKSVEERFDKFQSARYIKNLKKMVEKDGENGEELFAKEIAKLHDGKSLQYSTKDLGNVTKAAGLFGIPFYSLDMYNETMESTKNKNFAAQKTRDRSLQDSTRQVSSLWLVRTVNAIFEPVSNSSLAGKALTTGISTTINEVATRLLLGQPLTPKTHTEMKEVEKKKLQKHSFIHEAFGGKIKVHEDENKVTIGSQPVAPALIPLNKKYDSFLNYKKKESLQ